MAAPWLGFLERATCVEAARVWRERGGADLLFIGARTPREAERRKTRHFIRVELEFIGGEEVSHSPSAE